MTPPCLCKITLSLLNQLHPPIAGQAPSQQVSSSLKFASSCFVSGLPYFSAASAGAQTPKHCYFRVCMSVSHLLCLRDWLWAFAQFIGHLAILFAFPLVTSHNPGLKPSSYPWFPRKALTQGISEHGRNSSKGTWSMLPSSTLMCCFILLPLYLLLSSQISPTCPRFFLTSPVYKSFSWFFSPCLIPCS